MRQRKVAALNFLGKAAQSAAVKSASVRGDVPCQVAQCFLSLTKTVSMIALPCGSGVFFHVCSFTSFGKPVGKKRALDDKQGPRWGASE